jgi:ligand-binding SRPBCC domain-containing protein
MFFVKESRIDSPPSRVFAFYESAGALLRLTAPWERVELVEGGGSLQPGSRVVLKTQLGPFQLRWVAEHTEYEPGRLFADRQVEGPFQQWYHRHWFLDDGAGGTLLRDEISYEPPAGPLGRWLGSSFIQRKLKKLFDFRHELTKRIVESEDFSEAAEEHRYAGAGRKSATGACQNP